MGEKQHLRPETAYLYSVLSVNTFEMSLFEWLLQWMVYKYYKSTFLQSCQQKYKLCATVIVLLKYNT